MTRRRPSTTPPTTIFPYTPLVLSTGAELRFTGAQLSAELQISIAAREELSSQVGQLTAARDTLEGRMAELMASRAVIQGRLDENEAARRGEIGRAHV